MPGRFVVIWVWWRPSLFEGFSGVQMSGSTHQFPALKI
jgi:hypothetical protein